MLNYRKSFILVAIVSLLFVSSYAVTSTGSDNSYMDVSPAKAMELIKSNPDLLIIDVSPMWAKGHLPGALSFPIGNGRFEAAIPSWDAKGKYLIYCHGDAPSIKAAQMLIDKGFHNVYRLEGNYSGWVKAGYEVQTASYKDISAKELKQMMMDNPELIVIDVSPMYKQGHIPGAVNYYVGDGSLDAAIPELDPKAHYAVYCHVDSASILGANKLIEAGFNNVYRLKGNLAAWKEAGYPIEK